ncbi:MAG: ATP-binding protein [Pirellulaceae bacterium]|nr:ATP-binding protein [Pirellulaceae bacterium]
MDTNLDAFTAAQLQMVLDAPSINIFAIDREYRYVSLNRLHSETMHLLWGVQVAVGMNLLSDVIHDEYDRRKAKSNFDRVFAGEELVMIEAYGAVGTRRLYEYRYSPTRLENGETVGATVFASDVTERVRLAEERLALDRRLLEASQLESLGLLVGCVAHDFNNLLVPILLSSEVARSCVEPSHPVAELLATVIESTKSAADLTKQLLSFSGRGGVANELIELNSLINGTAEMSRVSVRRRAELDVTLSGQPLRVLANSTQLRQVITNLLINASEATRGPFPRVTIATEPMRVTGKVEGQVTYPAQVPIGNYAVITVSDNGCGISPEQLEHIFEPFYSTKGTGRGFGLTAVQGILRNHNGFMAIESEVGQGSTFRIGIPLAADDIVHFCESSDASTMVGSEPSNAPMRILIADDNSNALRCLTLVCERLGHHVTPYSNGIATIVAISTQQFDLILLDADMQDISCQEILAAIPSFVTTPVALMSGETHEATLISNPRVHSILAKPFSVETLSSLLKRFKPQFDAFSSPRERLTG